MTRALSNRVVGCCVVMRVCAYYCIYYNALSILISCSQDARTSTVLYGAGGKEGRA